MTRKSLRTPWRSEILSSRADSFFYSLVGVWSSLIALRPPWKLNLMFLVGHPNGDILLYLVELVWKDFLVRFQVCTRKQSVRSWKTFFPIMQEMFFCIFLVLLLIKNHIFFAHYILNLLHFYCMIKNDIKWADALVFQLTSVFLEWVFG
jgi:hypothetical protein